MRYLKTIFNNTEWDFLTENSPTNDSYYIF